MVEFHVIVDKLLVVEGFFKILINATKVSDQPCPDVTKLTANTAGYLCLLCSRCVGCIQHIGSSLLEQFYIDCLLVLDFLNLCKSSYLFLFWLL